MRVTQIEKDTNATTSNILALMHRRGRCRAYDKYNQAAPAPAPAGPGSSRIAAPADISTASAVLAAGGGTLRLLAWAGSCAASSLAGAESDAIESELLHRPRGRTTRARQSADVRLFSSSFSRAPQNTAKNYKNRKKSRTKSYDIVRTVCWPRNNQRIGVPMISCLEP